MQTKKHLIAAGVFAWYANLFWLIGVILGVRRKSKPAAVIGVIAVAIACSTFSIIGQQLPADESNVTHMTLLRLLPGCYVWMASLAALPLATLLRKSM